MMASVAQTREERLEEEIAELKGEIAELKGEIAAVKKKAEQAEQAGDEEHRKEHMARYDRLLTRLTGLESRLVPRVKQRLTGAQGNIELGCQHHGAVIIIIVLECTASDDQSVCSHGRCPQVCRTCSYTPRMRYKSLKNAQFTSAIKKT